MVSINSEIGKLKRVICHRPGSEIVKMTPQTAEKLLYDDILHGESSIAEHNELTGILNLHAKVYEVEDLLADVLRKENLKEKLVKDLVCEMGASKSLIDDLLRIEPNILASNIITGVETKRDTLTNFISSEEWSLPPLPNFFYTRDCAIVVNNNVITGAMANKIRRSEAIIMEYIFSNHSEFNNDGFYFDGSKNDNEKLTAEGGDILILRDDVLAIGLSERTTSQAIDSMIDSFKQNGKIKHIFAVILPKERSMIHLDMLFTMVDKNYAVAYEPMMLGEKKLGVVHINMTGKTNTFTMEDNIFSALKKVGLDLEPVLCGGLNRVQQEREQWMAGANFFTMAPGKIIGYGRNFRTYEQLEKVAGIPKIDALDVLNGKIDLANYDRYAISITGAELSRGGGGGRCMTMPIEREAVKW